MEDTYLLAENTTHPSDPTYLANLVSFPQLQDPTTTTTSTPTMSGIQTVFGGALFQREGRFADPSTLLKVYDALENSGVRKIDTAHIYGASEEILGQTGGSKRFDIDTKAPGGLIPGSVTAQGVQGFATRSKKLLDVEQVDVYYIHAPDVVPIEETLAGVNEVYKEGWFKRFGLSNFLAKDVQRIYDVCKREGYPLPTVYQGDYSAIARKQEEELLPLLRKLGIVSFTNRHNQSQRPDRLTHPPRASTPTRPSPAASSPKPPPTSSPAKAASTHPPHTAKLTTSASTSRASSKPLINGPQWRSARVRRKLISRIAG
jgi:diketogulonate reductase-like aldo/keto reductase